MKHEPDPTKVKKILAQLNAGLKEPEWREVDDYHSLMTTKFNDEGVAIFNTSSGVITKAFHNHKTGEIKTYYYKYVAKD
jgi:ribosomal protein S8